MRADGEERLLVYSDEGYAIVRPTGEVAGQGTVLRDIEPIVALAAMESYDAEPPDDWSLPHPDTVPQGSGEFGNLFKYPFEFVRGSLKVPVNKISQPLLGYTFCKSVHRRYSL
ncbi:MAG: hypothetical protein R6U63_02915, partial [Longimicrobiales bacterium]